MGLFQHRPEDPVEWAGLLSEPLRDESPAENLTDAPAADAAAIDAFGLLTGGMSISVPLDAPADAEARAESDG